MKPRPKLPKLIVLRPGPNFASPSYPESPQCREAFDVRKLRKVPDDADLVYVDSTITSVRACEKPYVVLVGGNWWWELRNRKPKLDRVVETLKGARMVLCLSKFLADFVEHRVKAGNTAYLPGGLWGTDHVQFKVNPKRFRAKKHYRIQGRPLISMGISMVGDIKYRGIGLFLEATREVVRRHNARVVCSGRLVGRTKLVRSWERKYGLEYINWKRDPDFSTGTGDRAWPRLLHQSDVFVHPSTWDAWGCVVADAMMTGVPSIVFTGHGSEEVGDTPFGVAPDDPQGMATVLDRLLTNESERRQWGQRSLAESKERMRDHRNDFRDRLLEALK